MFIKYPQGKAGCQSDEPGGAQTNLEAVRCQQTQTDCVRKKG